MFCVLVSDISVVVVIRIVVVLVVCLCRCNWFNLLVSRNMVIVLVIISRNVRIKNMVCRLKGFEFG